MGIKELKVQPSRPPTEKVAGTPALVEVKNITKRFPGVLALDDVSFEVHQGEVLALLGENGAGKSTIIKILSGVYPPDEGEVLLEGETVSISNPHHAQELGITTIHQEHSLAPHLNAIQNIFLGREIKKKIFGRFALRLDEQAMEERALSLADEFNFSRENLYVPVGQLGSLQQHVVEIVKALAFESKLVIMDEPTSGLTDEEAETLFDHIRTLRDRETSVLWVTHQLEELFGLADRAVVLRDGHHVGTVEPSQVGTSGLVQMMVGREVKGLEELVSEEDFARETQDGEAEEVLRVEGVSRSGVLDNISFTLHRGEVLGIAGLAGAGRTELARAIIAADKIDSGTVYFEGSPLKLRSPKDSVKRGIAILPEDRKAQGIFPGFSVARSISAGALWKILKAGFLLDKEHEETSAQEYVSELGIRTPSIHQDVNFLSGGNQQKTSLARGLFSEPKVLIFDEPTQGIDIGAKTEVYRLIREYVSSGGAAIVISSELPEVIGLADRILVIAEGQKAGEVEVPKGAGKAVEHSQEATIENEIMSLAIGGAKE